ncbi:hypothetical protein Efla_005354 [Eimeria flavescens]
MSQAKKAEKSGGFAAAASGSKRKFRLRSKNKRALDLKRNAAGKTSCKLRKSITPGTVLILLSSGYRGKRVVCLKQLEPSGLLLVTGPFTVNGVPLRRVNPRYVIATSTKIDVSGVDLKGISDAMFKRTNREKNMERKMRTKDDTSMFVQQDAAAQRTLPEERKKLQDQVDKALLAAVNKDQLLKQYLKTRFTLRANMAPHAMNGGLGGQQRLHMQAPLPALKSAQQQPRKPSPSALLAGADFSLKLMSLPSVPSPQSLSLLVSSGEA